MFVDRNLISSKRKIIKDIREEARVESESDPTVNVSYMKLVRTEKK